MGVKFLSFGKPVKIVSIHDDAIDKTATDMKAYQEDYDVSHLKFLPDAKPTYFNLSNVSGPDLVAIQQDHYKTELPELKPGMTMEEMKNVKVKVSVKNEGAMMVKYFQAGIKSYVGDDEKEVEMTPEVLATIPPMIITEFGSFIMIRSTIGDTKKKS